jgi:hypothetical protein
MEVLKRNAGGFVWIHHHFIAVESLIPISSTSENVMKI